MILRQKRQTADPLHATVIRPPSVMRPPIPTIFGFHSRYRSPCVRIAHTASGDASMIDVLVYCFKARRSCLYGEHQEKPGGKYTAV